MNMDHGKVAFHSRGQTSRTTHPVEVIEVLPDGMVRIIDHRGQSARLPIADLYSSPAETVALIA